MDRKTEAPKNTPPEHDPIAALKPFMPITWLGTAWIENLAALGSEITSFVVDRIKEDVKTQHALLNCTSVEEVQLVQAEFMKKAFDQYHDETGKLVELSGLAAAEPFPTPKSDS